MEEIYKYTNRSRSFLQCKLHLLWRCAMVMFAVTFANSLAIAQVAPVAPPTGGFHIDGGLRSNTPTIGVGDWIVGSPAVSGAGGYVFDIVNNEAVPRMGLNAKLVRDPYNSSTQDIIFSEGSKFNANPNSWVWSVQKAPNKNDINNAMYLVTKGTNNDDWLIIGGDRLATNGTSYIDFELLQGELTRNITDNKFTSSGPHGGRTVNDLVISMQYSNGGSKPTVSIYRWREVSPGTYNYVLIPANTIINGTGRPLSDFVFAETNRSTTENVSFGAFGSTTYAQFAFVEAAINMSKVLGAFDDPCLGIRVSTIFVKTKASDEINAMLKDMVQPIPVSINFGAAGISYGGPYCPVGTASVTFDEGSVQGGTFSVNPTSGLSINASTGEINLATSTPGTYTVTYTYTQGNCVKTSQANVTIGAVPASQTLEGGAYCEGATPAGAEVRLGDTESGVSYQLQKRGGSSPTFTWTNVGNAIIGDGNPMSFGLQLVGVYQVVATGAAPTSCTSTFGNAEVSLSANPAAPTVKYNPPACDSDKFSLTITGVSVGDIVTGRDKNGNQLPGSPHTVTSDDKVTINNVEVVGFDFTNIPAGSGYQVSAQTAAGCVSGAEVCGVNNINATSIQTLQQSKTLSADEATAYPIPFYDRTTIEFKSERSGNYVIHLYDMKGKLIKELKAGVIKAGETQSIEVDGRDLAEGMYLARIVSGSGARTVKLLKQK